MLFVIAFNGFAERARGAWDRAGARFGKAWVVVPAALLAASILLGLPRPAITRADLGIAPDEIGGRCRTTALTVYDDATAERPISANDYLPFAIASLNAYDMGEPMGFRLSVHSPEWQRIRTVNRPSGLRFDLYHKREPGLLTVVLAYSGSQAFDIGDWHANLAWFTAWLPIPNEYDDARETFRAIRSEAYAAANGDAVTFFATGHSLGGGLAQHIAYAFPCVSAPIFNSSFVVLKYRLAEPFTGVPIVHVYEDFEPVTRLRRLLFVDRATQFYRHYRVKAVDMSEFTHSITGLAVGIARNVVHCQARETCMVPQSDERARRLYCSTYGRNDALCSAQPAAGSPQPATRLNSRTRASAAP